MNSHQIDANQGGRKVWNKPLPERQQTGAAQEALGFWDFLDLINPLQHIPIVSTLYRRLTGDEIRQPIKIVGDFLYGGPLGLALAAGDAVVAQATGANLEKHALAALGLGSDDAAMIAGKGPEAAPATEEDPVAAVQTDQAEPQAASTTAVLPHGFVLPPRAGAVAAPTTPIAIDSGLDAALTALANNGSIPMATVAPREVEEERPAEETVAGPIVAKDQVPQTMMRALELYRRSAGQAATGSSLDTNS